MTILQAITDVLKVSVPNYELIYDEAKMINIKVDELSADDKFCYIEELREGKYTTDKYFKKKSMTMQIYFCQFEQINVDAIDREEKRNAIEAEAVEPFIAAYEASGIFGKVTEWKLSYPVCRFDANEINVMLSFNCSIVTC